MLRIATRAVRAAAALCALSAFPVFSAHAQVATSAHPVTDRMAPLPAISETPPEPAENASNTAGVPLDYGNLRAGHFIWTPQASATGPVEIVVSLPIQRAYVYRGGTLIGVSTVSSGQPGHETPSGDYRILDKARDHHSSIYESAPMPFMQRLTWDGIALHAGVVPDHPASHGCIRLPLAFARNLFAVTRVGARVHIIEVAAEPEEAALYLQNGRDRLAGD
jgi:lipoprotein-anchoring transpeptidase ErfK/SrfK